MKPEKYSPVVHKMVIKYRGVAMSLIHRSIAAGFLTATLLGIPWRATATVCDCLPEFNTQAEAGGTCSKVKEDGKWCRIKFNSGTTGANGEHRKDFLQTMQSQGLPDFDTTKANEILAQTPPAKWTTEIVQTHMAALFAVGLWDTAPERLKSVFSAFQKVTDRILKAASSEGHSQFAIEQYHIDAAKGCVQLTDKSFSIMLRTPFARPLSKDAKERRCAE